jgi:hypothetical protein
LSFERGQERAQYLEKKAARFTPSLGSLLHVRKPLSQRVGKDTSDFFYTARPQLAAAAEESLHHIEGSLRGTVSVAEVASRDGVHGFDARHIAPELLPALPHHDGAGDQIPNALHSAVGYGSNETHAVK